MNISIVVATFYILSNICPWLFSRKNVSLSFNFGDETPVSAFAGCLCSQISNCIPRNGKGMASVRNGSYSARTACSNWPWPGRSCCGCTWIAWTSYSSLVLWTRKLEIQWCRVQSRTLGLSRKWCPWSISREELSLSNGASGCTFL